MMGVLVLAEVLRSGHADLALEASRDVRTHMADRRVDGMITRPGVDSPPADLEVQHPAGKLNPASGMHAEITDEVLLRLALVVAVEAGVNDQDVAAPYVDLAEDVLGLDHVPVLADIRDIDDHALVDELVERQRGHVETAVGTVHRTVEMSSGVQGCLDPLRDDPVRLQGLCVVDACPWVADPAWRVEVPWMGQIDKPHGTLPGFGALTGTSCTIYHVPVSGVADCGNVHMLTKRGLDGAIPELQQSPPAGTRCVAGR